MKIFHPGTCRRSERHAHIYAVYELLHTLTDFTAATLFIVGSVLFFSPATAYVATWLFVIGSFFFALRPTLKLTREIHYLRIGEFEKLAARADD